MTQLARPNPVAILIEIRQTKVAHRATADECINSLETLSDETRDRIAVSQALLGRVANRRLEPPALRRRPSKS